MTLRLAAAFSVLSLAFATSAAADVTITDANIPGNPDENVLLNGGFTAMVITGMTNHTDTGVKFTGNELLTDPSNGQARIEAEDGGFDFLEIDLVNPVLFFTALEFNLHSSFSGPVTISAFDHLGNQFTQVLTLDDNGENRINVFSTNNQFIDFVRISASGDITDARQIRIGGIGELPNGPPPIPEPATWAMLVLGFGGIGAMLRQRRRARFA